MEAKKRLEATRLRLAKLADEMDVMRDECSQAVTDAAEALQRLAVPIDRDAA